MPGDRNQRTDGSASEERAPGEGGKCWLCFRSLADRVEWHHPVPKSRRGRMVVPLHPICHRTLHANFTNAELARAGEEVARLREHPVIARFIAWISDKPPEFHAPTRRKR